MAQRMRCTKVSFYRWDRTSSQNCTACVGDVAGGATTGYLLGELARLVRAVQDLVVEHREVQGEPQPDGVRGLHFGLADLKSVLVGFLRIVNNS